MYNPQLETFLRAADAGSFAKAAEQSYITPTAVIKQINLLEKRLGLVLFERTHRGLVLTKAGESLYRDAKYILNYCADSVARAKNAASEGVIRIGTSPITPTKLLFELWPKIQTRCPDMKLQLVPFENTPENAREILANLGQNIDIVAGMFDDVMLGLRGCAGFAVADEPFCVAAACHHTLAQRDRLTVRDLYGCRLMLPRRGWSGSVDSLREDLVQNHPEIQIDDFDFYDVNVFNRCENGGALLLSIGKWADIHPLLKIVPVDWAYSVPFGFLHSKMPSETVRRFLEAVKAITTES